MNYAKIKGSHNAIKTGSLAAEAIFEALTGFEKLTGGDELSAYPQKIANSWVYRELYQTRNVAPAMHKLGMLIGGAYTFIDQTIFRGRMPFTLHDAIPDHATLQPAAASKNIHYPKPDGEISFDLLSSVFLSNTNHAEDQPCHLQLKDVDLPIAYTLPLFDEPAQRYCPAGVYEIVEARPGIKRFQINPQNCVHCKTCDIKEPSQNIDWVCPEGGGGPNYPNM